MNPALFVRTHDGAFAFVQLLVWLVLLGVAAPSARRTLAEEVSARALLAIGALGALGVAVSLLGFPTERWIGLGHSASYEAVFRGAQSPAWAVEQWEAYVTYPVIRWGYWAIGGLVGRDDPSVLLHLNAIARGFGVVGIGLFAALWARRGAVGVAAASILVLLPSHALWGADIFNVAGPYAVATLCLVLALLAWRSGSLWVFAAAAASGALSVAGRVEWALLAPALLLVLLGLGPAWGRSPAVRSLRFWTPAVVVSGFLAATLILGGGDLTSQGGYHGPMGYLSLIARQAWIPDFLLPFDRYGAWLLPGVGAAALVRDGTLSGRAVLGLGLGFLLLHVGLHSFNDSGYRHELMPGILLITAASGLASIAVPPEGAPVPLPARLLGALLLGAVVLRSGFALQSWSARYFEEPEAFEARHPGFRGPELSARSIEQTGCYLVTDNERLWGLGLAGSHFNLSDPAEAAEHWDAHDGCILWLLDPPNERIDGLSVPDRAVKLRRWFAWSREGWARFEDGTGAVLHRMTEPPPGATAVARPLAVQSVR